MPRNLLALVILAPLAAAALTVLVGAGVGRWVAPGTGGGLMAVSLTALVAAVVIWVLRRPRD